MGVWGIGLGLVIRVWSISSGLVIEAYAISLGSVIGFRVWGKGLLYTGSIGVK